MPQAEGTAAWPPVTPTNRSIRSLGYGANQADQPTRQIEPSDRAISLIEPTPSEPDAAGGCFQRMLVYFEEYKTEWVADR
jgi:hypothetical protein